MPSVSNDECQREIIGDRKEVWGIGFRRGFKRLTLRGLIGACLPAAGKLDGRSVYPIGLHLREGRTTALRGTRQEEWGGVGAIFWPLFAVLITPLNFGVRFEVFRHGA